MDEEVERLIVAIQADTREFSRDVGQLRGQLEGPLADGFERAALGLERGLLSAVRRGKLGFEDLRRVALTVLADIADAALRTGLDSLLGRGGAGHGGLFSGLLGAISGGGFPGRATGGPVSPMRPYLVGERGPELFVPTSSGRIETGSGGSSMVNLTINLSDNGRSSAPQQLERSSRHVARAVRRALDRTGN